VNGEYWGPKLTRNVERDRRADEVLTEAGWTVVRIWEHEDPIEAAARVSGHLPAKPFRASENALIIGVAEGSSPRK
jgi:DNA mismatch endonuclease (patch repair protein)